jgi:hypothetical protein
MNQLTKFINRRYLVAFLFAAFPASMVNSAEFPRIGGLLIANKPSVLLAETENYLSIADLVVIGPTPGSQERQYVDHFGRIREVNSSLLLFRYVNVTALNVTSNRWERPARVISDYFDNPNRGGQDVANDGWARTSSGATTNPWGSNTATNIMDYVAPYDGSAGVANSESDVFKPELNERPVDFLGRLNYYYRVEPVESIIDGVYEDVNRRWPKVRADWNNDGVNSNKNDGADQVTATKWRNAMLHARDNMVGPNFDGRNAPMARASGRSWLPNGGYYLVNGSSWLLGSEVRNELDNGIAAPRITEYENQFHGGNHESIFGLETSRGGLRADGTATQYGSTTKSLNAGLTSFTYTNSHTQSIPELGFSAFIFEAFATTLDMARYCLAAGLMSDGLVQVINNVNGEKNEIPWMLDEFVGQDYTSLSKGELYNSRKWLGEAVNPAYPNTPVSNNGRVLTREFQHGLVVLLAGRAHRDDHMSAVETVSLPPAGAGFRWMRIDGRQDSSWNDGTEITGSVTLGTTAPNINKNAIILRRVGTSTAPRPRPPTILSLNVN